MYSIMVRNLGQYQKVLDYDNDNYTVLLKENLHNKQITYEAKNNRTKLAITYSNHRLFYSHFKRADGVSPCQK